MNSDRRHKSAVTKSLLQFYEYLSKALMYREDGKAIQYLAQKKEKQRKKDSKTSPHFKKKAFVWKLKMQLLILTSFYRSLKKDAALVPCH